jgi:hypothetical protein
MVNLIIAPSLAELNSHSTELIAKESKLNFIHIYTYILESHWTVLLNLFYSQNYFTTGNLSCLGGKPLETHD